MTHIVSSSGRRLVAEGIEIEAEELPCCRSAFQVGHGYLFGMPAPIDDRPVSTWKAEVATEQHEPEQSDRTPNTSGRA